MSWVEEIEKDEEVEEASGVLEVEKRGRRVFLSSVFLCGWQSLIYILEVLETCVCIRLEKIASLTSKKVLRT